MADYFPSLFMLPEELQVRSNIIMKSIKTSFTLPHKLRRVKALLEGQVLHYRKNNCTIRQFIESTMEHYLHHQ